MCARASFLGHCLSLLLWPCSGVSPASPFPGLFFLTSPRRGEPFTRERERTRSCVCSGRMCVFVWRACVCMCLRTPQSVLPLRGPLSVGFVARTSLAAEGPTRPSPAVQICTLSLFPETVRSRARVSILSVAADRLPSSVFGRNATIQPLFSSAAAPPALAGLKTGGRSNCRRRPVPPVFPFGAGCMTKKDLSSRVPRLRRERARAVVPGRALFLPSPCLVAKEKMEKRQRSPHRTAPHAHQRCARVTGTVAPYLSQPPPNPFSLLLSCICRVCCFFPTLLTKIIVHLRCSPSFALSAL